METEWKTGGWIVTFTGRKFFPLNPDIDDICIEDIAHALSMICRYGGHCREFYSVAQHSCMVADNVMPYTSLEGLLHDGTEAYLGDVVRPIKHSSDMKMYREAEDRLDILMHQKFKLKLAAKKHVKEFDNRALFTERKFILTSQHMNWSNPVEPLPVAYLRCWTPEEAKEQFLNRYDKLRRN